MNIKPLSIRLSLSTLLGVAVLGTAALAPARAQNNDTMRSDHDRMESDEMRSDPQPVGYPFAAPASLDLYHWKDYSMGELEGGSAHEKRMENRQAGMMRRHRDDQDADEMRSDPQPVGYPFAAPASVDMYHWKDYSMGELEGGSAHEKRMENRQARMHAGMADSDGMHGDGDERMPHPAPVTYPFAAPGSLDMYHWSDYTEMQLEPGSTLDRKTEVMEHNMRPRRMRNSTDSNGNMNR